MGVNEMWDKNSVSQWEELDNAVPTPKKPKEQPKPQQLPKLKEADVSEKIVITIYGRKGDGKTTTALGLPGTKMVLTFDNKSQAVKKYYYKNDKNIKIYNAVEYYKKDTEQNMLNTAELTYMVLLDFLKNIKDKPDWIVIDGLEILSEIAEMVMRKRKGLKAYQGIGNMGVWKLRKQLLGEFHTRALEKVKKGVIYTTYTQY